jgi:hypothetical protein
METSNIKSKLLKKKHDFNKDDVKANRERCDKVYRNVDSNENNDEFDQDGSELSINSNGLKPDQSLYLCVVCVFCRNICKQAKTYL